MEPIRRRALPQVLAGLFSAIIWWAMGWLPGLTVGAVAVIVPACSRPGKS